MALFNKKTEKVSFSVSKQILPIFETMLSHNGDNQLDLLKEWVGHKTELCVCDCDSTDSVPVELNITDFDNATKGLIYYYHEHASGWYEHMIRKYCTSTLNEWRNCFGISNNVQKNTVTGALPKKAPEEQKQFNNFMMRHEGMQSSHMYARKYAMDIEKLVGINIYKIKDVDEAQKLLNKFKPGGEYDALNNQAHGGFRATLKKYIKYLEYLNKNPEAENTPLQEDTMKISNKKMILNKCAELGYKVMPKVHLGSLNTTVDVYWFNIALSEFNQGITLFCYDKKTEKVHMFNIPAGAVDPKIFRIRADNNMTNIEILYHGTDFKDRESGFSFKQYYQGTFAFPKQ